MAFRLLVLGMCGISLSACVERAVIAPEPYVYHDRYIYHDPYSYPEPYFYPQTVIVERPFYPHFGEEVIIGHPRRHFHR